MKKLLTILIVLSMCMLCFFGCGKKDDIENNKITSESNSENTAGNFYTNYKTNADRPIAVMIDNDNDEARPHAGLEDAYLVYEVTIEGSATRLMALFSGVDTGKIGPVRSSRHYFLDYALEHDAVYTHYGWSPKAEKDIPALGVNNINGLFDNAFWRENKYSGDYHSAFTSMEKINEQIKNKSYRTEVKQTPLNYADAEYKIGGTKLSELSIPYAGFYKVSYTYNDKTQKFERFINGKHHPLQSDAKIEAKNIIIIEMGHSSLGDGSARINIADVGNGKGYFISNGEYFPITWSKSAREAKTEFKDEKGNEILLNHGQTWIQVVPSLSNVNLK